MACSSSSVAGRQRPSRLSPDGEDRRVGNSRPQPLKQRAFMADLGEEAPAAWWIALTLLAQPAAVSGQPPIFRVGRRWVIDRDTR